MQFAVNNTTHQSAQIACQVLRALEYCHAATESGEIVHRSRYNELRTISPDVPRLVGDSSGGRYLLAKYCSRLNPCTGLDQNGV